MKTFTNCAEMKAKQFLNLLQGYTKGIRMTAILVLLLMGVSDALGATIDNISDVWMEGSMNSWENKPTNWKFSKADNNDNNHYIGTFYIPYSSTKYEFKIRCAGSGWTDGSLFAIGGYWFTSDNYDFNKNMPNENVGNDLIECISTSSGYIKLDCQFWGNYNSNSRLVIKQSAVDALSPSLSASNTSLIKSGTSKITASCSGGSGSYTYTYKVICDGSDVTNSTLSATTGASVTFTAPSVTGKKTYTITVTAKDSHALLSGLATKTATKTITVEEAHNVTVSYKYGSTTIKTNTTTSNVKYATASSITAPTITGYKFSSWTLGSGITNKSANTTTNPISITTKSPGTHTLTANYTEDLTSTWHIVGEPTSIFHGAAAWDAHNDNMLKKTTGASTASKGSLTIDVKALPANNNSYQFKVLNTNGTKWYGWSTGDNHFWMNETKTTGVYTDQNNLYFIPNALGNYKFDVDWNGETPSLKVTFPTAYTVTFGNGTGGSSVTAKYSNTAFSSGTKVQSGKTVTFTQTASAGYTFKEWNTKSDGTGTKLSSNATYTHTVAATNTVYAVYTKNPDKTIYLEPTGHWNSDKAVFQAHVWQTGKTGVNLKMEGIGDPSHADGDNKSPNRYYKVEVPAEYDNILFFRKDNFATANENAWNKTGNLTIPVDNNVLYTITSAGKGKAEGYDPAASGVWKAPNFIYTITLGYCDFGTYGIKYNGQSYFSKKPNDNVTIDVPAGAQIEILEGQPFSNAYTGDVIKAEPTKEELTTGRTLTINGDITLDDNFKTKERHVVYLGVLETLDNWQLENNQTYYIWRYDSKGSISMTAADEGSYVFTKDGIKYYRFTIAAGCNSYRFERKDKDSFTGTTHACSEWLDFQIPLTDVNCFTLKNEKDGSNRYKGTWGVLPAQPGDYRLLYVEQVVEKDANGNIVVTRKKAHPSDIIRKGTDSKIVSLHTYKERTYTANAGGGLTYTSSNNPEIILQKYLGKDQLGNDQWEDVECQMVYGPLETLPSMAMLPGRKNASPNSNIDDLQYQDGIENIKKDVLNHQDKGNGVWNFVVKQEGDKASVQWNQTHRYTGEYYIRTDNAEGGWDQYTLNDNYMTRSDVSKQHSNYSHYYCKWIGEAGVNVKYTIANDYGIAISDTLEADATDIWGTPITAAQRMVGDDQLLPASANVRFSWNEKTNFLHRAYIAGATNTADRFLVLGGKTDQIYNAAGQLLTEGANNSDRFGLKANEEIFSDIENWVYQTDVQITPGAELQVTAKYNNQVQYFVGKEGVFNNTILQGSGTEKYLVRLLYDFKTNELISAYVPGASTHVDKISTNLMIIRQNYDEAKQLVFNNGDMSTRDNRKAYGVIEFTENYLRNEEIPYLKRCLYWVSFPFDVNLSEAFGSLVYGKHWLIQEYDGARRAAEGLWKESESFWTLHWEPNNITLKAGLGYVIEIDINQMINDKIIDQTDDKEQIAALYFPSSTPITKEIIEQDSYTVNIPAHKCEIVRTGTYGDRTIRDSHWNVIGVPSYVNKGATFSDPTYALNNVVKYYYRWDGEVDKYTAMDATTGQAYNFQSMYAYMVQYAGNITWNYVLLPAQIAAKKNSTTNEHAMRLELQQGNSTLDKTFIRLQEEVATPSFDFNYDLCKITNKGANIYSIITAEASPVEVAANVLPVEEAIIPLGIKTDAAGEYTFAMPEGTDGIVVELIDYETNTRTNMLLDEYTVNLGKGTFENRFALHVKPNKTTTSLEDVNTNTTGVKKYLIDGVLYMQKDGVLYDAQGKLVR